MRYYGIDISHWNEVRVLSSIDKSFCIMKVSQGSNYKDPKWETFYNACNVLKGAYIYNKVRTVSEAVKEAEWAVKCLGGRHLELGVWLDLEDSAMRPLSKVRLNEIIAAETQILQDAGYKVGIYCSKSWYENVLDGKALAQYYPFWIARYPYGDNGTVKESLSPESLKGCKMWQYSSKGRVNGITGNVDMNVCFCNPYNIWDYYAVPELKSVKEIALEVLDGKWGNSTERKKRLEAAGYNYREVQNMVNQLIKEDK